MSTFNPGYVYTDQDIMHTLRYVVRQAESKETTAKAFCKHIPGSEMYAYVKRADGFGASAHVTDTAIGIHYGKASENVETFRRGALPLAMLRLRELLEH